MRGNHFKRAFIASTLTISVVVNAACSETTRTEPQNRILSSPTSTTTPSTPPTPSTSSTSSISTTVPPEPVIPDGFYVGEGFALKAPDLWTIVDEPSVERGVTFAGVPQESADAILQQVTDMFTSGVSVAFYQFDDLTQYTPNITLSRLDARPEADAAAQAANTVADLQAQGFVDVRSTVGPSSLGTTASIRYTVPAVRTGFSGDLFASSHVVFGSSGTWTFTGLTAQSPESIDETVASLADSLLET